MSEDSAWTVSAGTLTALPFRKCATLQEEGLRSLPRYASNVREWLPLSLLFGTASAQSQAELESRSPHSVALPKVCHSAGRKVEEPSKICKQC